MALPTNGEIPFACIVFTGLWIPRDLENLFDGSCCGRSVAQHLSKTITMSVSLFANFSSRATLKFTFVVFRGKLPQVLDGIPGYLVAYI